MGTGEEEPLRKRRRVTNQRSRRRLLPERERGRSPKRAIGEKSAGVREKDGGKGQHCKRSAISGLRVKKWGQPENFLNFKGVVAGWGKNHGDGEGWGRGKGRGRSRITFIGKRCSKGGREVIGLVMTGEEGQEDYKAAGRTEGDCFLTFHRMDGGDFDKKHGGGDGGG